MADSEVLRERQWEVLARRDPYWTSCTSGKRNVAWELDQFLATGEREVRWTFEQARAAQLFPQEQRLAIDFGCGPGRLTGELARSFQRVIAIDISPTMLAAAKKVHAEEHVTFARSTDGIEPASADLIYSSFVLQHVPRVVLTSYLLEFSRLLSANGLLIFQYPEKPRWTLPGIAFKILPRAVMNAGQRYVAGFPEAMPMNWMSPKLVAKAVVAAGFDQCKPITGLRYSPNWKDTWYLCSKGHG